SASGSGITNFNAGEYVEMQCQIAGGTGEIDVVEGSIVLVQIASLGGDFITLEDLTAYTVFSAFSGPTRFITGITLHEVDHRSGGADALDHDNLAGFVPTEHVPEDTIHSKVSAYVVSQDTLRTDFSAFSGPTAFITGITKHASDHEVVGEDLVDHDNLTNFVANKHLDWTANVGTIDTSNYIEGHGDGGNCGAGSYPLGVNASGAVEDCTDATVEIEAVAANVSGSSVFVDSGATPINVPAIGFSSGTNVSLTGTQGSDGVFTVNISTTGLVIGTDVQAWDAELDTIAALTETNDNVMIVVAGAWASVAEPAIDCTNCTDIPAGGAHVDDVSMIFFIDGAGSALTSGTSIWGTFGLSFTVTGFTVAVDGSGNTVRLTGVTDSPRTYPTLNSGNSIFAGNSGASVFTGWGAEDLTGATTFIAGQTWAFIVADTTATAQRVSITFSGDKIP
ncbi:hypothetical protein LCGC14_1357840, partial [marine sediment metagenome]